MSLLFQLYKNGMNNTVIPSQVYNADSFISCHSSNGCLVGAFPFHLNSVCFG